MFLALLGGLEVFGLLGVILGPLIVSFFVSLMRMIERDAAANRVAPATLTRRRAVDTAQPVELRH